MGKTTRAKIHAARLEAERGKFRNAYEVIRPLLEIGVPEALYLYSTFSVSDSETDADFERRSLDLLLRAADLGYAPALYALGTCYEAGDLVRADAPHAALLMKAAADAGHPKAKFRHGLNLYHGSNEIPREEHLGLTLMRAAAIQGVSEAEDFLKDRGLL